MRILCDVERLNPLCSSLGLDRAKKKAVTRCFVGIGFLPGKPRLRDSVRILVTWAQNRNGVEYKVQDNIARIFSKFVGEGKATIRFKEPPEDLMFKNADPLQLKGFLNVLRKVLTHDADGTGFKSFLSTLTTTTTNEVKSAMVKLCITDKLRYFETKAYPQMLKNLTISNVELKKIDCRIFSLKHLRFLDLSHNNLQELPGKLGLLDLEDLNLAHNALEVLPNDIFSQNLGRSLRYLNVSNNLIRLLPKSFCKLSRLTTFNACNNQIAYIPHNVNCLRELKIFLVAKNRLSYLPGTIRFLHLDFIDVSENPLNYDLENVGCISRPLVLALLEFAARAVVKNRLVVREGDLPKTLIDDLSNSQQCLCGNVSIYKSWQFYSSFNLKRCSKSVMYVRDPRNQYTAMVPVDNRTCSSTCALLMSSSH